MLYKREKRNLDSFKDGCDLKVYKSNSNRKTKKGGPLKEPREVTGFMTNINIVKPVTETPKTSHDRIKSASQKRSESQEFSKRKDMNTAQKKVSKARHSIRSENPTYFALKNQQTIRAKSTETVRIRKLNNVVGVKSQLKSHVQKKKLKGDAWAPFGSAHVSLRENQDTEFARGGHEHLTESVQI